MTIAKPIGILSQQYYGFSVYNILVILSVYNLIIFILFHNYEFII